MDYAKNELKFKLEELLTRIDESGAQNGFTVDEQIAIVHDDLLQYLYCELEQMICDIDMIGFEKDDFEADAKKILEAKDFLMTKGYDFSNLEVFCPYPVISNPIEQMHFNYLKLCGYHFHEVDL